jgi:peptidoglycan/xylan/chitin deacetylase (PgdA/CDA1 family)
MANNLILKEISLFIIYLLVASSVLLPANFSHAESRSAVGISHTNKVVILTFGDTLKSQITNAKPILDKYGFKGSFFITCLSVGSSKSDLTWQDISALQKDGQDIESKAMTHRTMTQLSPSDLNYEIAGSKKCLANHGINATAIATIHGIGRNNVTLIDEIGKYYNLAVNGFGKLMPLHCTRYDDYMIQYSNQTNCRTYFGDGTLTDVNRYSLREWSHNSIDQANSHDDSKTFEMFVHEVNIQDKYNKVNGSILAVPIVAYHMIDNTKAPYSTDVTLFDQEMKYLHDNGFKVLTINDLGYDTKNNFLYIKPSVAQLTVANPVSLTKFNSINVTHMNGIAPKQSSAITQNNTALAPLSSNSSSYISHPMPRVNHLSLPNSKSYTSSGISGSHPNGKSSKHHANTSSHLCHPMPRVNHLSLPNSKSSTSSGISGKSSKHHGYCSYSDYKSNACT